MTVPAPDERNAAGTLAHTLLRSGTLYQTSTIAALLEGVYDSDVTIAQLLTHGDFGLGTFNHLDGEMVVLDGVCYHLRSDGTAVLAGPDERTPFAAVTYFAPEVVLPVEQSSPFAAVRNVIETAIGGSNAIVAIRVSGTFSEVRTRTLAEQHRPYPRLADATMGQQEAAFGAISGSLVGYRTPAFEQGISVAGYHLHFIDESRQRGGHVLDCQLESGRIELAVETDLHLSLPQTAEFLAATSHHDSMDAEIRRVEGSLSQD